MRICSDNNTRIILIQYIYIYMSEALCISERDFFREALYINKRGFIIGASISERGFIQQMIPINTIPIRMHKYIHL